VRDGEGRDGEGRDRPAHFLVAFAADGRRVIIIFGTLNAKKI